jgi:tetratricopeptide (TPR) repeat protein
MNDWLIYADDARNLAQDKKFGEACTRVDQGLDKINNHVHLLVTATDICRAWGNHDKSLEYSQLLIAHHPGDWYGYVKAAQDLLALNRLDEAQNSIRQALEKFSQEFWVLIVANDICRAVGNFEKSLECAQLIIVHHPDEWNGYYRAAQDLLALKRFDEAQIIIQAGLEKIGNQFQLLMLATDVFRASGNHEKSLECAQLVIVHHPDDWNGYYRAAQDLLALKRFDEAQTIIQAGLEKIGNQFQLLVLATDVFRASGNHEKALECAQLLIIHHPDDWNGYYRAAQDLLALKRFDGAQVTIQEGLGKIGNQFQLLLLATDVFRASSNHEKSLEYAQLLIFHHPDDWNGYYRAAQDLLALKRFDGAQTIIEQGLASAINKDALAAMEAYVCQFNLRQSIRCSLNYQDAARMCLDDFVAYSAIPGFFSTIQSAVPIIAHNHDEDSFDIDKSFIFVAGLGRSGTSALGKLLNISSEIEMYTELYDAMRVNGYSPKDFSPSRLKIVLPKHPHPQQILQFEQKNNNSLWIGDKRPHFQFCLERTYDNISINHQMRTIFINRDLPSVLRSSHARSENLLDTCWSLEHGIEHTILVYNASCRQAIDLSKRRPDIFESIMFVDYRKTFSDIGYCNNIFKKIGVKLSDSEAEFVNSFVNSSSELATRKAVDDDLSDSIEKAIDKYLDREAHRLFGEVSGLALAGGSWNKY